MVLAPPEVTKHADRRPAVEAQTSTRQSASRTQIFASQARRRALAQRPKVSPGRSDTATPEALPRVRLGGRSRVAFQRCTRQQVVPLPGTGPGRARKALRRAKLSQDKSFASPSKRRAASRFQGRQVRKPALRGKRFECRQAPGKALGYRVAAPHSRGAEDSGAEPAGVLPRAILKLRMCS